jgi:hypothetical protein
MYVRVAAVAYRVVLLVVDGDGDGGHQLEAGELVLRLLLCVLFKVNKKSFQRIQNYFLSTTMYICKCNVCNLHHVCS